MHELQAITARRVNRIAALSAFVASIYFIFYPRGAPLIYQSTSHTEVNHINRKYSCEYRPSNLRECYNLLSPHINRKPAWFFLGDSQINFLFNFLTYPYNITRHREAKEKRCGVLDYYNFSKADMWNPPSNARNETHVGNQTQGPYDFGLKNPFCMDLLGWKNEMLESSIGNNKTRFVEKLCLDYASDVEQQTPTTRTSQETMILYITNQLERRNLHVHDTVCVTNVGIHDQKLCAGKSDELCLQIYLQNVGVYLNLLQKVCGDIVWIAITPVFGETNRPQKNETIYIWNEEVSKIISGYSNTFYIDVWHAASAYRHIDNVHFEWSYYITFGALFTSLM